MADHGLSPTTDNTAVDLDDSLEQAYINHRAALDRAKLEYAKSFDHWLIGICTGAIGLSITFIGRLPPGHGHAYFMWLYGAWICLLVGLLCALTNLYTTQCGLERAIQNMDKAWLSDRTQWVIRERGMANPAAAWVPRLNLFALASVALGVIGFGVFAAMTA